MIGLDRIRGRTSMQIIVTQVVPTLAHALGGLAAAALVTKAAGAAGDGLSAFLLRTWLD